MTAPRQYHHLLRQQGFARQVAGVCRRAQGAENKIHIPRAQLGGQQVERTFVGDHLDAGVFAHQAHDGLGQDAGAAQGQGADLDHALQRSLQGADIGVDMAQFIEGAAHREQDVEAGAGG